MKKINFIKAQGLGNDFVLFFNQKHLSISKKLVNFFSDRKIGIGCDLIALVNESKNDYSDLNAKFYNRDGSEAEVCGNALRCIGKYYFQNNKIKNVTVETSKGLIDVEKFDENLIIADLGRPNLQWHKIPLKYDIDSRNLGIDLDYLKKGFALNVGNPHVIFFVEEINKKKLEIDSAKLMGLKIFPEGVNVSIVKLESRKKISILTFERGAGLTEACGSGAGASAFVSYKLNYCGNKIEVCMPGGNLNVEISKDDHILTIGEGKIVFEGNIFIKDYLQ